MKLKEIYKEELCKLKGFEDTHKKLNYSISLLRSILQLASITAIDIADKSIDEADMPHSYSSLKTRFYSPADGLLREIIDSITPLVKHHVSTHFYNGWFESRNGEKPLCNRVSDWVEFRNERHAHGVIDDSLTKIWSDITISIIESSLEVFEIFMDRVIDDDGKITLDHALNNIRISTPLVLENKAIIFQKLVETKGFWYFKVYVVSDLESSSFNLQLSPDNPLIGNGQVSNSRFRLSEVKVGDDSVTVYNNIPSRQTPIFEGRNIEKEKLINWFDENQQRACLVFGDGGVGKTTLVLEFFNSWLDGEIEIPKPIPEIVCFYSAKMTEWNDSGLKYLRGSPEALDQCLRELMHCIESSLSKKWYTTSGDRLVDKVESELLKNKFTKNDVLLIIDNTETFVNSTSDLHAFTDQLKKISHKIGRVLLTSRRREQLAFEPIPLSELSEEESISLIKRLANQYYAIPLSQAGDARLRKVSRQLFNKPLLIDALVKHIARSGCGIDEALDNLYMKTNDDLLEFLYEDAWARMSISQQYMFMVLTLITYPVNDFTVARACQLIKIPIEEFHVSLNEAYFCNVTDFGSTYDVHIVNFARDFFKKKSEELNCEDKKEIENFAADIDEKAIEKDRVDNEYRVDRVEEAFRTQAAKSAKIEADKGHYDDADIYYQLAVSEDPLNASLYDRYAWFLLHKKVDINAASENSKKSLELNPNNCDALMTAALIEYRRGRLKAGDFYISESIKMGKSESLGSLRMGIARYHSAKKANDEIVAEKLISESSLLIKDAEKKLIIGDYYYQRNRADINKYKDLITKFIAARRMKKL
ncbi:type IV pilus biogenesis/stability protein PilW [Cobetia amphilecti]|uniref:Uncharacterized protein n=1 Tax=Cobetia amphilecti TaxID=1055104 RepID=A0ABT6UM26_9GAMM|nr:hypothetical protein [Cobetia amphilecti]MBR9799000.1 hypothetical protein [Gammaproteobacteria bacterium]MDI5883153.1 hypothetical protein [Cobetia amphilecti]